MTKQQIYFLIGIGLLALGMGMIGFYSGYSKGFGTADNFCQANCDCTKQQTYTSNPINTNLTWRISNEPIEKKPIQDK